MRTAVRCVTMLLGLGCCLAGPAVALAEVSGGAVSGGGAPRSLSLGSPFQPVQSVTPQQVSADVASRTAYEGLGRGTAVALAKRDFHIETPVWTTAGAEEGVHLERYLGESAAVEKLPGGQHVVVSSTIPLRTDNGAGELAPVSLALQPDGEESYVPKNPLVTVVISRQARGGISLPLGISATPVSTSSAEAPTVVGDGVVFTNAALDTDLLEEPLPSGAGVSWLLRSQRSPKAEALRFTLPPGASLRPSTIISGGAEVIEEGKMVLLIPPASAQDADGQALATSYTISGDVLTTRVNLSGRVDFPVLLDPNLIFEGYYGSTNGSGSWAGWQHSLTAGFELLEEPGFLEVRAPGGQPDGSVGELYIYPPGPHGKPGSAGITRVDVSDMDHGSGEESEAYAEIGESNGSTPIYTFNGANKANDLPEPYATYENLSNRTVAFCAQSAGGEDGGSQPLCNEQENQGAYFVMSDTTMVSDSQYYDYVGLAGAKVTFRDPKAPNMVVLNHSGYTEGEWRKSPPTGFSISAESEGLGIAELKLEIPAGNPKGAYFTEKLNCNVQNGFTGCPTSVTSKAISLSGASLEETGMYSLAPVAVDAAENVARPEASYVSLNIDKTPPVIGSLTGTLGQAAGGVIGNGNYTLGFDPIDGSKASPQSGVHTVEVKVDGKLAYTDTTSCTSPKGLPAEGCYGLSGSWTMNGQSVGAGTHKITVVGKDWAGNESSKSFNVTVNEAGYESVGPGAVNLETGDFRMSPTDVSLTAGGAALSVGRTYDSRGSIQGLLGPLGPQWALSLPTASTEAEWQSLAPLSSGSIALTRAHGGVIVFASKEGGGFVSPAGYQTDTLTEPSTSPAEYRLADSSGDYTAFTQPASGSAFFPSTVVQASGAGGLNPVKYTYAKTSEGFIEPTEMLGPEPSEGACTAKLVKGCRALTFEYAASTSATGESPTEWGSYKGHLARVYFTAWEPAKGEMAKPIAVAEYAYDYPRGRLRAKWDPRISTPLKTVYGYKNGSPTVPGEDLITAVTPPGQQTWVMTYGTIAGDTNVGRLLKVTRASASTPLWKGEAPKNTVSPKLSGSPEVGSKMGVSAGTWSNEPVGYAYQWEDCNTSGGFCTPILGATNQNYTLVASDAGHTIVATVTATNGWGSVAVASAASAVVGNGTPEAGTTYTPGPGSTIDYGVPVSGTGAPYALGVKEVEAWAQKDDPAIATAIFAPDEPQSWPASNYERATIYYMDSASRTVNVATPSGGISTAEYNKANNNLERTLSPDNRATALKEGSKSIAVSEALASVRKYSPDGSELELVIGPEHLIKIPGGTQLEARKYTRYHYDENAPEGGPYRLVTKTTEVATWGITKVEEADLRTVTNSYSGQSNLGWKLHEPTSSTTTAGGVTLTSTTKYEASTGNVEETQTPAASGKDTKVPLRYSTAFGTKGSGGGQFGTLGGDAIDASKNVWAVDPTDNRIEKFSASGEFIETIGYGVSNGEAKLQTCTSSCRAGLSGSSPGEFSNPSAITVADGYIYVADYGNYRVEKYKENGEYVTEFGSKGTNAGQTEGPTWVAVNASGDVWVADPNSARVDEFSASGTAIVVIGYGVSTGEDAFQICTPARGCRAGIAGSGPGQFDLVRGIAISGATMYVADYGDNRIDEFNEKGEYTGTFGSKGTGNGQFNGPTGIAFDATNGYLYVTDYGNDRVQALSTSGEYISQFGTKGSGAGQLAEPAGIAINSTGDAYIADTGNYRLQEWVPAITGNEGAHTTQTIYYTSATNPHLEACGNHPEWAGLPCQAQAAAQPEAGLPNLPVTTYPSYNIWNEPLTTVDTVTTGTEKTTRTATIAYDSAGRTMTSAIASSVDKAVPTVTDEYSTTTGALVKQSTTSEGKTKSISSEYNTLGQLTTYTDAEGVATKYEYESEKDYRLTHVVDAEGTAAASTQTYGYNTTTGTLSSLKDSAAGTFTASYDLEGNMTTEGYPNGMNANYTYNPVGEPVSLEYIKTTHCTSGCTWYADTVSPSIHGQWLAQTSNFSKENYSYDEMGRLTEVQETPTGKGCTARLYGYDEDGNRTSLTARESSTATCPAEGGTTQSYAYDTADRLSETGVSYETFGNITALPAADAGGSPLTSSYYVNNALSSQEQNGQKISYNLDPDGRVREAIYTGTTKATVTSHYAGPGNAPAWTITSTGSWTRNIPGINGGLGAIQANGGTPTLQLANLHGDIIATASMSETESKLIPANETTEYGVPRTTITASYSWLGSDQVPTELPTGIIGMGARAYIPQLGRFEQADPQPGGSANAYAYTDGDPVNEADPGGEYTSTIAYDYEATESGSAAAGLSQEYAGPGAILPPPVSMQIEEEFNAHPPWDASSAFDAGPSSAEMAEIFGCTGGHACASSIFGEVVHWVSSNAHKLVAAGIGAVFSLAIGAVTLLAVTSCGLRPS
jgi:RHS repeat-associated protein